MKTLALIVLSIILIGGTVYLVRGSNPLSEPHNQITWLFSTNTPPAESAEEHPTNPLVAATIIIAFSLMLFLPFWPGLRESIWPRDQYPLPIELGYSKDPRHLGKSFRRILFQSLGEDTAIPDIRTVQLSKEETIEIKASARIKTGETIAYTLMVQNDMHTEEHVVINRDLFVSGAAKIGSYNTIRTLACDGNIDLCSNTRVIRWIDAVGKISIADGCNLGISCSTIERLALGHKVVFRRLFGNPIVTPGFIERPLPKKVAGAVVLESKAKIKTIEDTAYYRRKDTLLKSGSVINQDVIVKGNLHLADHVTINGSVRCQGHTTIGKECIIRGDLFSEGPVEIYEGAVMMGNIFSQDAIRLFSGVRVSQTGHIKSVIAKKKIIMDHNVSIYGYMSTEGKGTAL